MNSVNDAQMLSHVGLCLTGFQPGRPVTLTITAGARAYTTILTLATEAVEYPTDEIGEDSLFDGHPVTVHPLTSSSYYQSATWRFVPTDAVRDQLTAAGTVTVNAKQTSGASSRITQQITRPGGTNELRLDNSRFAIWGFKPGLRVPVGLYEQTGTGDTMTLIQQLGVVLMPKSGIAIYTLPAGIVSTYGGNQSHCLAVPIAGVIYNCYL
jgi:hypothetical protein